MKNARRLTALLVAFSLVFTLGAVSAFASTFTDAHGNVIELDDTLEAYAEAALFGADDAVFVHIQQSHAEAFLFQGFQRVQHRVVLEGGGDDMGLPGFLPRRSRAADGLVVGLAAAGGEGDLPGLGPDDRRDLGSGLLQTFFRVLAQGVEAGGVAVVVLQTGHHGVDGGAAHFRGGRVVGVYHAMIAPFRLF